MYRFDEKKETIKFIVVVTFIWSMLAHAFSFFNLIPQHDGINHSFNYSGSWEIALGRFLLPLFDRIRGAMTVPWMTGVFATLYIAVGVLCICEILEIENKVAIVLIAGFLTANASILDINSTFGYVLDAYMLSMMLAVLGMSILIKGKAWKSFVISAGLFAVSLGLYQAEIMFAVMLFMMYVIKIAMNNCESKSMFRTIGRAIAGLFVGAVAYVLGYKIVLKITNIEATSSYNGISSIKSFRIKDTFSILGDNMVSLCKMLFSSDAISGRVAQFGNLILLMMFVAFATGIIVKKRKELRTVNIILIVLCIMASPIIAVSVAILMNRTVPSLYICYSIFMLYVLGIFIWQNGGSVFDGRKKRIADTLVIAASAAVLLANVEYCNNIYSYQKLMYDRTLSVATSVMYELNHTEGYVPGETPVVLELDELITNKNMVWIPIEKSWLSSNRKLNTTYANTFKKYTYVLGHDINYVEDRTFSEEELNVIEQMPVYPQNGYVMNLGDVIVIRLSEVLQ